MDSTLMMGIGDNKQIPRVIMQWTAGTERLMRKRQRSSIGDGWLRRGPAML